MPEYITQLNHSADVREIWRDAGSAAKLIL